MFHVVKAFLEGINWVTILISLVANLILIFAAYRKIRYHIKRKLLFRIKTNEENMCALAIGLGRNDPYKAVLDFLGEENKDKIIKFWKYHKANKEKDLSIEEIESAIKEIQHVIGEIRRKNIKEVLVFYAGPLAVGLRIGYEFRNFFGTVKFMQFDRNKKNYAVMATLTS